MYCATSQERVRSALSHLSPESRGVWVRQAMAIKSEFGEDGFEMWDQWSSLSSAYRAIDARHVWKSVKAGKGIGIGSLFYDAKQAGWKDDSNYKQPSATEIEKRRQLRAQRDAEAAAHGAAMHESVAEMARAIWEAAEPCDTHPYLARKGVKSFGLRYGDFEVERLDDETGEITITKMKALLVPLLDRSQQIWSLQAISSKEGGAKLLLKNGRKSGNFFVIGKPQTIGGRHVFILVGGYATGASVHEATGHMVVVCIDASNLRNVARQLRERDPDAVIVVGADNDLWGRRQDGSAYNPGMEAAKQVASESGALIVAPEFCENDATGKDEKGRLKGPKDWNDWHCINGAKSLAECFDAALARVRQVILVPSQNEALGVAYALECMARLASVPPSVYVVPYAQRSIQEVVERTIAEHPGANLVILAALGREDEAQAVREQYGGRVQLPPHEVSAWQGWGALYLDALFDLIDGLFDVDLRAEVEAALARLVKVATSVERTVDVSEVLGDAGAVESHQSTMSESDVAPTEILLEPGELPRIVDLGEQALLVRAQHLYIRGGRIVRTVKVPTAITSGKQANITQVKPIAKHALAEELTKVATWVKVDKRRREGDERVVINCPLQVAETLMARDQWSLRSLTAIIHGPTLRDDGSILEMAGYDEATGLLLESHTSFAPVPQCPSREDGLAALARLDKIVSKFPFVSEADKAVWFAGLLTAAIRRSLPTSPMFAFTAPTAGTGKSYMADLIATIVTGEAAPALSQGRSEEETEKRLTGVLLAGHTIINLDNCTLAVDGDFLCQVLTQPIVEVRKLGGHDVWRVPGSATILATGNSLVIAGDMTRRALVCNLDAGVERPELREFDFNPVEMAKRGRAGYLVDVLTILRAFHVAGSPCQAKPLGSFDAWSDRVRSALIWLGVADPCATMERTRKSDPKLSSLREVLRGLHKAFGNGRVRVREIINEATSSAGAFAPGSSFTTKEYKHPDLREALLSVAGDGGAINSRRLGKWLSANLGRPVDGLRLIEAGDDRDGVKLWMVDSNEPPI